MDIADIEKGMENSRYNMVNDIAIAQTLQDYDTVDDLLTALRRCFIFVFIQELFL